MPSARPFIGCSQFFPFGSLSKPSNSVVASVLTPEEPPAHLGELVRKQVSACLELQVCRPANQFGRLFCDSLVQYSNLHL